MDSDPKCTPLPGAVSERLVVGAGNGIQNAFVYVKDGLGARTYAVPTTPVLLDQKGCQYVPHVLGVQVGQTVKVANSDPAMHNVHSLPKTTASSTSASRPMSRRWIACSPKAEIGLPLKCDVHGWMNAYVNAVPHPFFAVTGDDGKFEIKGLPPGTYTVEVWHETLGTQSQSVTVDGKTPPRDRHFQGRGVRKKRARTEGRTRQSLVRRASGASAAASAI